MDVRLSETTPLVEAASGAPKSRRFRARLIQGGIQGSSGFYPEETLRRDGPNVFKAGMHCYADHPSLSEAVERPERSVKDLAGRLASDAVYEGDGLYADIEVFPHYAPMIEGVADAIGMSIRALGTCEPSQDESIRGPVVTSLAEGTSVDFVTKAGAGGKVLELIESARAHAGEGDEATLWEAKYDADQLKTLLGKGQAVKNADGQPSYPIADEQDLKNAIRAVGRGGADHDKIRTYIIGRAKSLKKSDLIPADWTSKARASESVRPTGEGTELQEAGRTIGSQMEARIHSSFSLMADDLRGDGRLTRDERIGLSTAFGAALKTFTDAVEADLPQLYKRSPWECPEDESEDTPMSEALNEAVVKAAIEAAVEAAKKPMPPFPPKKGDDEQAAKDTSKPADGKSTGDEEEDPKKAKKMKENEVPTDQPLSEARISALLEAALKPQNDQIAALQSQLAEAGKRDQVRDNLTSARALCEKALATSGLPTQSYPRVLREATVSLPTGDDGALDAGKFDEAVKAAIQDHKSYLAELDEARGYGFPRGLGSDQTPSGDSIADLDKALEESLQDIGMTGDEAKIAATGR